MLCNDPTRLRGGVSNRPIRRCRADTGVIRRGRGVRLLRERRESGDAGAVRVLAVRPRLRRGYLRSILRDRDARIEEPPSRSRPRAPPPSPTTEHVTCSAVHVKRNVPPVVSASRRPERYRIHAPGRGRAAPRHIDSGDAVLRRRGILSGRAGRAGGASRAGGTCWPLITSLPTCWACWACRPLGALRACRACCPRRALRTCESPRPADVPRDPPRALQADQHVQVAGGGPIALRGRLNTCRDDAVADARLLGVACSSNRRDRGKQDHAGGRE